MKFSRNVIKLLRLSIILFTAVNLIIPSPAMVRAQDATPEPQQTDAVTQSDQIVTGEPDTSPTQDSSGSEGPQVDTSMVETTPGQEPEGTPVPTDPVDELEQDEATPAASFTLEPTVEQDQQQEKDESDDQGSREPLPEIVDLLDQTGSILTDSEGNPIPLASQELTEEISYLDPYIDREGIRYMFLSGGCDAYETDPNVVCAESTTPVQDAVNFAAAGESIYLDPGTYNESVNIDKQLTLLGNGGLATITSLNLQALGILGGQDLSTWNNLQALYLFITNEESINEALNLVAEDGTLNLAPGTYQEKLVITKSVKIIGSGKESTTISQTGAIAIGRDMTDAIITVNNGADVEIAGLTISGNGVYVESSASSGVPGDNTNVAGVYAFGGSNLIIHDTTISVTPYRYNLADYSNTSGIVIGNDGSAATSNIYNNLINGYNSNGVYATNSSTVVSLTHNTIDGGNSLLPLSWSGQYGVYINGIAQANIDRNYIFENDTYGLRVVGPSSGISRVIGSYNTITNNNRGVRINENTSRLSGSIFTNNNISNNIFMLVETNGVFGSYNSSVVDLGNNFWNCSGLYGLNGCYWKIAGFGTNNLWSNNISRGLQSSSISTSAGLCPAGQVWNGSACVADADADLVPDSADNCPIYNPTQVDVDGDLIGDACDTIDNRDTDGDGVENYTDNCPTTINVDQLDTDLDGQGNVCDPDDDNDGVTDAVDNCPLTANTDQLDTDGDGTGNACDNDDDADGVSDGSDNCPLDANAGQANNDGDGQGDVCDTDDDNDGVIDDAPDNCPWIANPAQEDIDSDGLGDACDSSDDRDTDEDSVRDVVDNCPLTANTDQADLDGDGLGNVCDPDDDGDGVADTGDNCPVDANAGQEDADLDGSGDVCDPDDDNDTVVDPLDVCSGFNDLIDTDADGTPDGCDATPNGDTDLDGIDNLADNCPLVFNPTQLDSDGDGVGDACEPAGNGKTAVVPGLGGLIPVTGAGLYDLSCTEPSTLVLKDGTVISFNTILCGYQVSALLEDEQGLPAKLLEGSTFQNALTLTLVSSGNAVNPLPAGTQVTIAFTVPDVKKTWEAHFWNPESDNGTGAWEVAHGSLLANSYLVSLDHTGTLTLVRK